MARSTEATQPRQESDVATAARSQDIVALMVLAAALALLNAGQWLIRVDTASPVDQSAHLGFACRFIDVALYLALALASRTRLADTRALSLVSLLAFASMPALAFAQAAMPAHSDEQLVVDLLRRVTNSVGLVSGFVAATLAFVRLRVTHARVVAASWLVAQTLFFCLSVGSSGTMVATVVKPAILLAAGGLLVLYHWRLTPHPADAGANSGPAASATPHAGAHGRERTALLLGSILAFPLLFCVISEFLGGVDAGGTLYEPASEIGAVALLAALVAVAPSLARPQAFAPALVACALVYATGYLLLPAGLSEGALMTRMLVKMGFAAFQVCAFLCLVGCARKAAPRRAFVLTCLFWAAYKCSKAVGRGIVLYAVGTDAGAVWGIATGGLYAMVLCSALVTAWRLWAARGAQAGYAGATLPVPTPDATAETGGSDAGTTVPQGFQADPRPVGVEPFADAHGLSPRERDVLGLAMQGHGVRDIAQALSMSEGTVKTHLHNIYRKCQVADRHELAVLFKRSREG